MARIKVSNKEPEVPVFTEIPETVDEEAPLYDESPEAAKLWAKQVWFHRSLPVKTIAELIGVHNTRMLGWVSVWRRERQAIEEKRLAKATRAVADRVERVFDKVLTVLEVSANDLLANNASLTVDQFKGFTSSAEALFKMQQLASGRPTEILGGAESLTWGNVLAKLQEVDIVDYGTKKAIDVTPVVAGVPKDD